MARNKGILPISANFEPQIAEPFDGRWRVPTKAELTLSATWTAKDGNIYTYTGIPTIVWNDGSNNGLYICYVTDYTNINNWVKIGDIPHNMTTQGNTFNGASQLVQLDENRKLPAIDGSQLTGLPSSGAPIDSPTFTTKITSPKIIIPVGVSATELCPSIVTGNWTFENGSWSIVNGKLVKTSTGNYYGCYPNSIIIESRTTYRVTINVESITASLQLHIGGGIFIIKLGINEITTTTDTVSDNFYKFYFYYLGVGTCTISSISVKKTDSTVSNGILEVEGDIRSDNNGYAFLNVKNRINIIGNPELTEFLGLIINGSPLGKNGIKLGGSGNGFDLVSQNGVFYIDYGNTFSHIGNAVFTLGYQGDFTFTNGISSDVNGNLSFTGYASKLISLLRNIIVNSSGNDLLLKSGGATVGATNKRGGKLVLSDGVSTGNSTGTSVTIKTHDAVASGTSDQTATDKINVLSNGDIELLTTTQGIIMKSPDGTRYKITVSNDGTLTTTAV